MNVINLKYFFFSYKWLLFVSKYIDFSSVNQITTLADFQWCSNLQELYIRKNNIKDINELLYLRQLPKLKSLWLADNPCAQFEK